MTAAEERRRQAETMLGLRSRSLILPIVFFVLTCVAIGATYGLLDLLFLPKGLWTAILCIVTAEVLIQRFRFDGSGVESALWIGGLFAFIFGIPSEAKPEGLLLFALACAMAGARVRNPLIGAMTAVFVIFYFEARGWYTFALLAGVVVAAAAVAALAREWQRPSTEHLFIALMLVGPLAGCAASISETSPVWALLYFALAIGEFASGIRRRDRAVLIAGMVTTAIVFVVLRELFTFAIEWKLVAAGASIFAVSAAISRKLRSRHSGFVVTAVKSAYEETLRVFGSVVFSTQAGTTSPANPQPLGGGGSFGGAGSSGTF